MGMAISAAAKDQFVAGQVAIVITFLPAFLLSGFIFNIDAMPTAVQALTHLVAARYFIAVSRPFPGRNRMGRDPANAAALAVMAAVVPGPGPPAPEEAAGLSPGCCAGSSP